MSSQFKGSDWSEFFEIMFSKILCKQIHYWWEHRKLSTFFTGAEILKLGKHF